MNTSSKLTTFIAWWLKGLSYFVPAPLRQIMRYTPHRLTVEIKGQQLICKYYSSEATLPDDEQVFVLDSNMRNADLSRWLQGHVAKNIEVVLLLPEDMILQKSLVLPAAVGSNLRQVLGFEMDRRTPFSAAQVYFDYLIVQKDDEQHQLRIQLYITPRDQVDRLLDMLVVSGIKPKVLNIAGHRENTELNLLPPEKRQLTTVNQSNTLTALLAFTAFGLFLAVLYVPLLEQKDLLTQLETDITGNREVVTKLQEMNLRKNALLEKAGFLVTKRNNYIPVIDVLNELTRIIPDDAALNRLSLTNGKIQLYGESSNASLMIQSIESSDMLSDVQFSSPVVFNEVTQKDKFSISAQLSGPTP